MIMTAHIIIIIIALALLWNERVESCCAWVDGSGSREEAKFWLTEVEVDVGREM